MTFMKPAKISMPSYMPTIHPLSSLFVPLKHLLNLMPQKKESIESNINRELQIVYDWLCVNRLSLNIPKTKFMMFHHRQRNIDSLIPTLSINGNTIDYVSDFISWDLTLTSICHLIGIHRKFQTKSLNLLE